jgi:hypothetical protein
MAEEKGRAALLGRIGRYGSQQPDVLAERENADRKAELSVVESRSAEAMESILGEIETKRATMEADETEVVGNDMALAQTIVSQATMATKLAADQTVKEHGPIGDRVAARHAEIFNSVMNGNAEGAVIEDDSYVEDVPEPELAASDDAAEYGWLDTSEGVYYKTDADGNFLHDDDGKWATYPAGSVAYEDDAETEDSYDDEELD